MYSSVQTRARAERVRRKRKAQRPDTKKPKRTLTDEYKQYRENPVGFGREVLGHSYTPEIEQMLESVRDNIVTVAQSGNSVGKTYAAADVAAWFYRVFPDSGVYTAAAPPEENLKFLLWGEIDKVFRDNPAVFADSKHLSMFIGEIGKDKEHLIRGQTIPSTGTKEQREAKFSGKHHPYMLFIVDEGDAVPAEVYKGIESCMSGGHVRLLILFNPRHRSGPVYKRIKEHRANVLHIPAINHPNVTSGEDIIPGAVTRDTVGRRINIWTRPLASGESIDPETCFSIPDYLVGSQAEREEGGLYPPLPAGWRSIEDPAFYYMVLGRYPAEDENQMVAQRDIDAARSRYDLYVAKNGKIPPAGISPIMGLDAAEYGRDPNSLCFRYGGYLDPFEFYNGIDPDTVAIKAAGRYKRKRARVCLVDATGLGSAIAPRMRRLGARGAAGVKVGSAPTIDVEQGEFKILRDQILWLVANWLKKDPGSMLPNDEELIEELLCLTYRVDGGFIRVIAKDTIKELIGRSPDRLDSLALTFAPKPKKAASIATGKARGWSPKK